MPSVAPDLEGGDLQAVAQVTVLDGEHQHVDRDAEAAVAQRGLAVVQVDRAVDPAQLTGDRDVAPVHVMRAYGLSRRRGAHGEPAGGDEGGGRRNRRHDEPDVLHGTAPPG